MTKPRSPLMRGFFMFCAFLANSLWQCDQTGNYRRFLISIIFQAADLRRKDRNRWMGGVRSIGAKHDASAIVGRRECASEPYAVLSSSLWCAGFVAVAHLCQIHHGKEAAAEQRFSHAVKLLGHLFI